MLPLRVRRASRTGDSLRASIPHVYHVTERCKHIAAIEHLRLISSEASLGKRISVKEHELKCPECKKKITSGNRWYRGEHEDRQMYICGRRFPDNLGFEYRVRSPLMSGCCRAWECRWPTSRCSLNVKAHVDTITRMLYHYSKIVEEYAKTIKAPGIQDTWGTDEMEQKIRGEKQRIVAVMDLTTRFILAWEISDTKVNHDAVLLLRIARDRAGKIPRPYIADGLDRNHIAFKKLFYTLKGLRSIHIRDIHLRNLICNTNKQERLNGEFASRFRPARGINKEESLIFRIAVQLHQAPWRHRR